MTFSARRLTFELSSACILASHSIIRFLISNVCVGASFYGTKNFTTSTNNVIGKLLRFSANFHFYIYPFNNVPSRETKIIFSIPTVLMYLRDHLIVISDVGTRCKRAIFDSRKLESSQRFYNPSYRRKDRLVLRIYSA